ncbi:prolyl-tRNA synthetase associated domain-containing protein [Intestinibacter sp.]
MNKNNNEREVLKKLDELNIEYDITEHPEVFTIEDMDILGIMLEGNVVKNLFLRNSNGSHHYIVVMDKDKKANLKSIKTQINSTSLKFASEDRLKKYLHLKKGSVTPLGILNDTSCEVQVLIDKDLIGEKKVGVHPNTNTSTLWISLENLVKFIENHGNPITYITI